MQAPTKEIAGYATLLENLWNNEFVDAYQSMAQWSRDHVPMPGALTRQIVDDLIRRNVLMTGSWELAAGRSNSTRLPGTSSAPLLKRTTSSRSRPLRPSWI